MIVRALGFLCLVVSLTARAAPAPTLPLRDGERLTYRVSWAIVPGAGEIKIAATQDNSTPAPQLVVTTNTATRRLARMLLPFEAQSKATFDLASGRMLSLYEDSLAKGKKLGHTVTFDYAARQANYVATEPVGPARLLPIPAGDPTDLIMGLLQTRSWDLKPGEKRDVLVLFDDDFYELTIHMARYEQLQTPLGTFKTIVLEPRMDKTAPKGMFKRGSSVRVWISQDAHRLPVKFEVEFKIGTGTATLESYQGPPATGSAPDAKNSRP
jgi:hypothetical protein